MNKSFVIAKKNSVIFDSLVAYILLLAFLGFSGFFTWIQGSDVFMRRKQIGCVSGPDGPCFSLFRPWPWKWLQKKRNQDHRDVTTKSSHWPGCGHRQIFGMFAVGGSGLVVYHPVLCQHRLVGKIDHGATITGYIGLLLMASAYIAIVVCQRQNNQIVAFLLALLIGIFFLFIIRFSGRRNQWMVERLIPDAEPDQSLRFDLARSGGYEGFDLFWFHHSDRIVLAEYFIS